MSSVVGGGNKIRPDPEKSAPGPSVRIPTDTGELGVFAEPGPCESAIDAEVGKNVAASGAEA